MSKNYTQIELGRRGGLKGGKARALLLSIEQRSAIARKAANKRWGKPAIADDEYITNKLSHAAREPRSPLALAKNDGLNALAPVLC